MSAWARREAAYRAQLVGLGVPVDTSCSVCGGRLSWCPAGVAVELVGPAVAAGIYLDVMDYGGDGDSPVSLCGSCWTLAVWCSGRHVADHFAAPVWLHEGSAPREPLQAKRAAPPARPSGSVTR